MSVLNALLRGIVDALLAPFRSLPPIVGLTAVSLVTAVGMLLVFKATSNQEKLEAVKRRIHACLFEIRLFNDDLLAILRAQIEILRHNATYLRLSIIPMLWMIVPLLLLMAQLEFHYGYRGLAPGESFLVKVQLKDGASGPGTVHGTDGAPGRPQAVLEVPQGLRVETSPVWIPSLKELDWRLRADSWGDYEIRLRLGGETYTKTAQVSQGVRRRSPFRLERGLVNQLFYPAEDPLPGASPIRAIELSYPAVSVTVLRWRLNWIVVFFALSLVFAFILRKRFGVTM